MKIKRSKLYVILIVSLCLLVSLGIYKTGIFKKITSSDPITLNVSLYKYIPHYDSFEKTVEACWSEKHPDVKLNFADWDCYSRTLSASEMDFRLFSMTDDNNIPVFYMDAAAVSAKISDEKKTLALDLLNMITNKDTLVRVSMNDGNPRYPF